MDFTRIKITSWTSSFRYPNLISGFQPTLEVPPISTILGLFNAAAGIYLHHTTLKLGYYFDYEMKAKDLETIYQLDLHDRGYPKSECKSNVIMREFLFNCRLFLYIDSEDIATFMNNPYYQLVLGRSGDLASVCETRKVTLEEKETSEYLSGQIVPFKNHMLPGNLQSLPKYFSEDIPRRNIGAEPYSVISCFARPIKSNLPVCRDIIDGKPVDIYIHNLNFNDYVV